MTIAIKMQSFSIGMGITMIEKLRRACIVGGVAYAAVTGAAIAADAPVKAPAYKAAPADHPWMVRVRALGVVTRDSGVVDQVVGSGLSTTDTIVPELDISYFFTRNIAVELVLGVTPHRVSGTGAAATNGLNVGKAWLLPPTLVLQYHFTNFGAFKPYLGAGVNYTWFFNQSAGNVANAAGVIVTRSNLHDTGGVALQAGFDYMIDRHWGWNVDVKWIYLRPDWDGASSVGALTGKVKLDPFLIGTGLTYKF